MHSILRPALRQAPYSPSRLATQRTFVSATLLSRTDFEKRTVQQIKEELKGRGLSTTGKKQDLVSRLMGDETKRANAAPPPSSEPPMTLSTPAHSEVVAAPRLNLMPALLNEGYVATTWPASVSMPDRTPEPVLEVVIPFIPDKYDSHLASHDPLGEPIATPAVSTASDPATLPGGGPQHAAYHADEGDPITAEQSAENKAEKENSVGLFEDILAGIGLAPQESGLSGKGKGVLEEVYDSLEKKTGVRVPPLGEMLSGSGSGQGKAKKSEEFKFDDRPLSQQEQTGVYALLGLLVGSWALGGIMAPVSDDKKEQKRLRKLEKKAQKEGAGGGAESGSLGGGIVGNVQREV